MRHWLVLSAAAVLLASGAAYAQSGQGGYLGKNPGATAPTGQASPPPAQGSGQGGYLGTDPGSAATSNSGSSGASGHDTTVGHGKNQGESTDSVPGKVGGSEHR
ncbi:MAG TPA: hypothetical protein VMB81_09685 [Candidatus Sulfotelmatobacter sp.]|nr:hypothetical protein [Candidatus Sulfotelmatobacter sp.]